MSNNRNITYNTDEIESFYKNNRIRWEDFYPSEKYIFEAVGLNENMHVLDIGCGCGGLGSALKERFGVSQYTGIDINEKAIQTGKELYPNFNLLAGDILCASALGIQCGKFDIITSLSCIDWNVELDNMLSASIAYLKPGGRFISSFRLTNNRSLFSLKESFQYINFNGKLAGEKAPYVIINYTDLMEKLRSFSPKHIQAYGYLGKPSDTAVTPYEEICFSVFSITKGPADNCELNIKLPESICNASKS